MCLSFKSSFRMLMMPRPLRLSLCWITELTFLITHYLVLIPSGNLSNILLLSVSLTTESLHMQTLKELQSLEEVERTDHQN